MPIKFYRKNDYTAEIDIDLGGKNTFNITEMNELIKIFEKNIEEEIDLKVILIKSSNPDYFATGPEIKEIARLDRDGARYYVTVLNVMNRHIAESPVPVICSVKGVVSGIGLDIASSCDFRFAEKKSNFADLSSKYGILSPSYLALRLAFLIGTQKALEIVLSSKKYSAEELYKFNYLSEVFDGDVFDGGVAEFIKDFTSLSIDSLRLKKRIFIDLWKNYLNSNQFSTEEVFSELLKEGKDWKKTVSDFNDHFL
ncbi:MAG: enoyl-CoA hydratase/isomerase family protein [bacterium]|jgi:enoyl-CoA hydratase/carnithine racemase